MKGFPYISPSFPLLFELKLLTRSKFEKSFFEIFELNIILFRGFGLNIEEHLEQKLDSGFSWKSFISSLNTDLFEVKPSEDYSFLETDLIRISIFDIGIVIPPVTPPDTGDNSNIALYIGLLAMSTIGGTSLIIFGKKKKEEVE